MKILLVTWYFPPLNDVAALRTGAMAKFLEGRGHTVHVLTAARIGRDASLNIPLPEEQVIRTAWFDVDRLKYMHAESAPLSTEAEVSPLRQEQRRRPFAGLRAAATQAYLNLVHIPDRQIGWYPFAVRFGREIMKRQGIELVYASGPSFTSFLVAKYLSTKFRVPWVAEYRDAWSDDFYKGRAAWRNPIDRLFEASTIRSAAGIVALSEPWADFYRKRYGKPAIAVYNGFDVDNVAYSRRQPDPREPVSITYMGVLYGALRDPSPLYQAIRRSNLTPLDVQVVYYGPSEDQVRPLAEKLGVSSHVFVKPRVAFAESLRIQRESDVLLLLQAPDDPRNVPAKLFEYFASGRPILGLGLDNGVPAKLIEERAAGVYVSDPDAIARQLGRWVEEKRKTGLVADVAPTARVGLSRSEQLQSLDSFLARIRAGQTESA